MFAHTPTIRSTSSGTRKVNIVLPAWVDDFDKTLTELKTRIAALEKKPKVVEKIVEKIVEKPTVTEKISTVEKFTVDTQPIPIEKTAALPCIKSLDRAALLTPRSKMRGTLPPPKVTKAEGQPRPSIHDPTEASAGKAKLKMFDKYNAMLGS
jgi:hypothetical protein